MFHYVIRRISIAVPTLLIIAMISFALMHFAPGGPFDTEKNLPPEVLANVKAKFHLDKPVIYQFFLYVNNLLHGDFGPSFVYTDFTVTELILQSWPVSAELGFWAFILAVTIGVSLGTMAALNQNSGIDYTLMAFAMTGIVTPNFVVAPILVLLFAVHLGWLPAVQWNTVIPAIYSTIPCTRIQKAF